MLDSKMVSAFASMSGVVFPICIAFVVPHTSVSINMHSVSSSSLYFFRKTKLHIKLGGP